MCLETYTTPDKFTQYWFWAFDEVDKTELPPPAQKCGRADQRQP